MDGFTLPENAMPEDRNDRRHLDRRRPSVPLPAGRRHRQVQGSRGQTAAAIEASGAEIVTVAVRRVNLSDSGVSRCCRTTSIPKRYTYLPNTAGCHTANDAVRTLRLAREAGGWNLVKLEVLGPPPHLYPDMVEPPSRRPRR